nr:MAG TPA: hypothetical protein [Bacteriophage sp.]
MSLDNIPHPCYNAIAGNPCCLMHMPVKTPR